MPKTFMLLKLQFIALIQRLAGLQPVISGQTPARPIPEDRQMDPLLGMSTPKYPCNMLTGVLYTHSVHGPAFNTLPFFSIHTI